MLGIALELRVLVEKKHLVGSTIIYELLCCCWLYELDEGRAFGSLRFLVDDYPCPAYPAVLGEEVPELLLAHTDRQVPDEDGRRQVLQLPLPPDLLLPIHFLLFPLGLFLFLLLDICLSLLVLLSFLGAAGVELGSHEPLLIDGEVEDDGPAFVGALVELLDGLLAGPEVFVLNEGEPSVALAVVRIRRHLQIEYLSVGLEQLPQMLFGYVEYQVADNQSVAFALAFLFLRLLRLLHPFLHALLLSLSFLCRPALLGLLLHRLDLGSCCGLPLRAFRFLFGHQQYIISSNWLKLPGWTSEGQLSILFKMSGEYESRIHLANYNKVIDIIEEVSPRRRYQTILFAFFLVIFFFIHFADSTNNFLFNNPVFLCGQDDTHVTEEEDACPIITACTIQNAQSLTAQLGLYCGQQKANRNMIKSMKGVGLWIGIALVGVGVDRFGKKPFIRLAVAFLIIWVMLLLIGSFLNNNTLLTVSLVSYGIGNSIVETISFIYITRFLPKDSYEKLTIASYFVGSGMAQLVFGLIRSVVASWLALLIVASVPIVCVFVLSFFLQEDPYYLLEQERTAECEEVVRFIGQLNGASEAEITQGLAKLEDIEFQEPVSVSCGDVLYLLKANLQLVWLVVVLGVTYMTTHITEASLSFISQEIGYSYQSNISILGAASIAGSLTFFFVITAEEKRQRGFVWSTTIEVLLSCLFLTPLLEGSKLLQVVLLFAIRLLKDWSLNFYVRLKVDCLSKSYQTSLTTAILLIGKTADVLSPQLIQYQSDHHINVLVMNNAIKFVFGVCLVLLVTEKYHEVVLNAHPQMLHAEQPQK